MVYDLSDISMYACWTRLNETPEDIARMTKQFIDEFSTRIDVGKWEPLKGTWDGTQEDLVRVIERNPVTDDDGDAIPGDGYHFTLANDSGPISTDFNVRAGADRFPKRVASPKFSQSFYRSVYASAPEVWDASVYAAVVAFDPAFVTAQERSILRMTRRGGWTISYGYRVWINDWIGTITTHTKGLTTERLSNGTLIRVPDHWPAQQVVDALTNTFHTNNLNEVPITQ